MTPTKSVMLRALLAQISYRLADTYQISSGLGGRSVDINELASTIQESAETFEKDNRGQFEFKAAPRA